jgi:hypothetical protein
MSEALSYFAKTRLHYGDYDNDSRDPRRQFLVEIVEGVRRWISQQAVKGTNIGTQGVSSIYAHVVESISRTLSAHANVPVITKLLDDLRTLHERTNGFVRYELTSPLEIDRLHSAIRSAPPMAVHLIRNVIQPYIESIA